MQEGEPIYHPTAQDRRVYESWRLRPGNGRKTIEDFMKLRGPIALQLPKTMPALTPTPSGIFVESEALTVEEIASLNAEALKMQT